jgi:hypothetical protein
MILTLLSVILHNLFIDIILIPRPQVNSKSYRGHAKVHIFYKTN